MNSHADSHDRDKLAQWYEDLAALKTSGPAAPGAGQPPVYAVFLVSAQHQAAHDVFRRFRTAFESRRVGFQHLVIFGQHGVSTTVKELLAELGLAPADTPVLALFPSREADTSYTLHLPSTIRPDRVSWPEVLAGLTEAIDKGDGSLNLADLPGVTEHRLANGALTESLGRLLDRV